MASEEQIQQYNEQGYFIADDAVAPGMLPTLTEATRRAADKVRAGEVVDNTDQIGTGGEGKNPNCHFRGHGTRIQRADLCGISGF